MRALHVAKTYKVEWEDTNAFNHQSYEFRRLLNELGVPVASMSSDDDDDYLDFEVRKEDWRFAISALERETLQPGVKGALAVLKCSREKALETFRYCLAHAEQDEEWMHFSFF